MTTQKWAQSLIGGCTVYVKGPSGQEGKVAVFTKREHASLALTAVNNHDALIKALEAMTGRYVDLVNCGDCGHWDPEQEGVVKLARTTLAAARGEK